MSKEIALEVAKNTYTFYLALFNTLTQEVGEERANALQTKTLEEFGAMQGKMVKAQAGAEEFNAETAFQFTKFVPESLGMTLEVVETSPDKVVFRAHQCPIYDAGLLMGQEHASIEAACPVASLRFMDAFAKQFNPNLSYQCVKFRTGPDDYCDEALVLN
ncbi:MAG: L-2-amino-thiazoline-4-carboxylic acid hydrolase [Chloroflexi bacterium]|nr:L-2-amino-thiazoline-4-carboxylic acid hydrolase [Chloroflexota bacterium]